MEKESQIILTGTKLTQTTPKRKNVNKYNSLQAVIYILKVLYSSLHSLTLKRKICTETTVKQLTYI